MKADLFIPPWFAIPWFVLMARIIRVSIYEMRVGLLKGFSPFLGFSELMRRIDERRKIDPEYDRMKGETWRWFKITAIWWAGSFVALVVGSVLYDALKG